MFAEPLCGPGILRYHLLGYFQISRYFEVLMARSALATDPCHYSRPELAAKYLEVFAVGLTSAVST
jgi:hypothetical protein